MQNFHEFRRHGIGGSDMAAIVGCSPGGWTSALDIYKRIVEPENYVPQPQNESMSWGKRKEPIILDHYEAVNNLELDRNVQVIHPHYEFLRGNLDAQSTDKKITVEAKSAKKNHTWGEIGSCQVPPQYLCQIVHYAYITNPDKVDIAVLFTNDDFALFTYHRNEKMEKLLMERAIRFWEKHIIPKKPPLPTSSKDIENYIRVKPQSTVVVDEKTHKLYEELREIKHHERRIKDIKENLKMYMGENEVLVDQNENVLASYKEGKMKRIDSEYLKKEGIYDQFSKEVKFRRLLIK